MQWLELSGQELSKHPDMIGQSSGHSRCAVAPLGPEQSRGEWYRLRQRDTQTHMRPGKVVEGLKENHTPPPLGAILTEAPALTHERRQGMTQGKVEPLKQTGADREPPCLQALGTAAHTGDQLLQTALGLLFDDLPIDQIGMGVLHRVLGASWLARAGKGLARMIDRDQRRKVTPEAIAKKAWDTQDHSRRHLDEL